jgi:sec-independent protein translocase protein TatA
MDLAFVLAGVIGPTEWILIALIVVLLFGGKKIPELMRGLGKGLREFKDASKGQAGENTQTSEDDKKQGSV